MKPQELSAISQFDPELRQPNKTKKIILLNSGLLNNDNRGNNDQCDSNNFHSFESQNRGKVQLFNPSFNEKPALGFSEGIAIIPDISVYIYAPNLNIVPQFDRKVNYNKLFWKVYIENELVVMDMRQCIAKSKEVQARINSLEVDISAGISIKFNKFKARVPGARKKFAFKREKRNKKKESKNG